MTTAEAGDSGHDSRLETAREHDENAVPLPPPGDGGLPTDAVASPRYAIEGQIGTGATSYVLAAHDRSLDRPVALKVLSAGSGPAIAHFMREARITATINHPNVISVHDLEFVPSGTACIVMRRVEGRSLGDELRAGEVGDINRTLTILLKVCDALASAHTRGIVHQDIKPDNIMLGQFGEVVVLDWGEARTITNDTDPHERRSVGTPAFMSPEQARGEPADQRSDVYSVAATAWLVLTGQHPVWHDDPTTFWERKRRGVIDPLPPAVARRLPRRLLAICEKALSPDPADRYADATALGAELQRYQGGQAIAAYRESLPERLRQWVVRHAARIAMFSLIGGLLLAAGVLLYGERMKRIAHWGAPVLVETFTDDSWRTRWTQKPENSWRWDGNRVICTSDRNSTIRLNRTLTPPIAIEYEGEILEGSIPGDLSVCWREGDDNDSNARLYIQAGAHQNSYCGIWSQYDGHITAYANHQLQVGKRHQFRVELDGNTVSQWIDGELILQSRADIRIGVGRLELFGFFSGKAFTNIRVYEKGMAEQLSALAIGSADFADGRFDDAARHWKRVAEGRSNTALGEEALYLQGLAEFSAGHQQTALDIWSRIRDPVFDARAEVHRLGLLFDANLESEFLIRFSALFQNSSKERQALSNRWRLWMAKLLGRCGPVAEQRILRMFALRDAMFPSDEASVKVAAQALCKLDRASEALTRFSHQPRARAEIYRWLGRRHELEEAEWATLDERGRAMVYSGAFDRALKSPHCPEEAVLLARIKGGYITDAEAADPNTYSHTASNSGDTRRRALLFKGQLGEAVAPAADEVVPTELLYLMGDWTTGRASETQSARYVQSEWMEACESGHIPDELRFRVVRTGPHILQDKQWFLPWFAIPLVDELSGHAGAWDAVVQAAMLKQHDFDAGIVGHFARFCAGAEDESAFMKQPCRAEASAWLAIAKACKAEAARHKDEARAAWAAFLALPAYQRLLSEFWPDPLIERFAAWRMRMLAP
ncbi:MAG: serine/threonine-protein kinase [Planctomycetota bacterium]